MYEMGVIAVIIFGGLLRIVNIFESTFSTRAQNYFDIGYRISWSSGLAVKYSKLRYENRMLFFIFRFFLAIVELGFTAAFSWLGFSAFFVQIFMTLDARSFMPDENRRFEYAMRYVRQSRAGIVKTFAAFTGADPEEIRTELEEHLASLGVEAGRPNQKAA